MDHAKLNDVERDLVTGLEDLLTDLKSDAPIESKYTCQRVVFDLAPRAFTAQDVKSTRALLNASQALFAHFLGVSVKSVCAWESGKKPSDMACRFMEEIQRNPDHYRDRLRQSIKVKPTGTQA